MNIDNIRKYIAVGELVDLLHNRFRWPRPTELSVKTETVWFNLNTRRYIAFPDKSVLEVCDGKVGETLHSLYAQGVLRGADCGDSGLHFGSC